MFLEALASVLKNLLRRITFDVYPDSKPTAHCFHYGKLPEMTGRIDV